VYQIHPSAKITINPKYMSKQSNLAHYGAPVFSLRVDGEGRHPSRSGPFRILATLRVLQAADRNFVSSEIKHL